MAAIRKPETFSALLIFLLFLGASTQLRVEVGPTSFALVEPLMVGLVGLLVILELRARGRWRVEWKGPAVLVAAMALWAALLRPWAIDWQHGLSDVRDWILPAATFVALLASTRMRWRPAAYGLLAAVAVSGAFGLAQHVARLPGPFAVPSVANKEGYELLPGKPEASPGEKARPPRVQRSVATCLTLGPDAFGGPWVEPLAGQPAPQTIETSSEESQGPAEPGGIFPALALFAHPNNAAPFFLLGMFLAAGVAAGAARKASAVAWLLLSVSLAFALLWTYAETSILAGAALLPLGIVLFLIRPSRGSSPLLAGLAVLGLAGLLLAIRRVVVSPPQNLCWRMGLWGSATTTIAANPRILLSGNGLDLFALYAYYWHPHNLFLDMLLDYGVVGLLWTGAIMAVVATLGVRAWRSGWFRREPVLLALWLGLLTFGFVGMAESVLLGIEGRALFLGVLVCFLGLFREWQRGPPPTVRMEQGSSPGEDHAHGD